MNIRCVFFGHDRTSRERRGVSYVLVCEHCGDEKPMLETEVVKGPRHEQEPVLGKPLTTTFRESPFGKRKVG